jgi:lysophospholipase
VIPGFDMTPEAALTKLAYVLSKSEWDIETKRQMMQTNLRGELTGGRPPTMQDWDLVEAVARSLRLSSAAELQELGSILFPAMLNAAVIRHDIVKLESLKGYVSNFSADFYFHRLVFFRHSKGGRGQEGGTAFERVSPLSPLRCC